MFGDRLHDDEAGLKDDDSDYADKKTDAVAREGFAGAETKQSQRLKAPEGVPDESFYAQS